MNDHRDQLVRRLRDDHQSGATQLALNTLFGLREFLEQQADVAADEILELASTLRVTRPSMVPLNNALLRWQQAVFPDGRSRPDNRRLLEVLEAIIGHLQDAADRVARHAADLIEPGDVILTHSNSSVVQKLFRELYNRKTAFSVIATLSGPGNEGARLAEALDRLTIPVTLITDAQMGLFMARATVAVCGCDSWLADQHFVNKSGTYLMALAARDQGKPCLVLADSFRNSDQTSRTVQLEEMSGKELNGPRGTFITTRNIYFETVPERLVSGRLTEHGLVRTGGPTAGMPAMD